MIPNLTHYSYIVSDMPSGSIYGVYIYILTFYLTFYLAFFLAFYLPSILTYFLAYILTFFLAFSLAFCLACVRVQASPADSRSRDMVLGSRHALVFGSGEEVAPLLKSRDPHLAGE